MSEIEQKKKNKKQTKSVKGKGQGRQKREASEYEQRVVDLARVTRVTAGGKRMRFRACVVIGDKKGKVGYGLAKGADVQAAISKSFSKAKKQLIKVPMIKGTIPHEILVKFKAAKVLIKPAVEGTGVIAGGAVRIVLELAGIKNVSAKMLGSTSKHNNVHATIEALKLLKNASQKKKQ